MLKNAEEEVPPHVWSAVSSHLEGDAGKRSVAVWCRRVAIGVAAAAAVILVAVIGAPSSSNPTEDMQGEAVAQVQQEAPTYPKNVFSTKPTASVENNGTDSEAPAVEAAEPHIGMTECDSAPLLAELAATPEEESVVTAVDEREEPSGEVKETEISSWDDPFDVQEEEVGKKKKGDRRLALIVGGNVSTNGNASSLSGNRMMMTSSNSTKSDYETVTRVSNNATYSVPVSFGIGVRKYVTDRLSIGIGLNYYLLGSTFTGTYVKVSGGVTAYNFTSDIHSTLQYLGIPLSFNFDFVQAARTNVYFYAGGTLEKGVRNRYRIEYSGGDIIYKENVDGVQYSVFGGLGVEFKLNDFLGVYVDPSLHWYPDCDQPFSIRTQQQLMVDLSMGFRFDF